MAWKKGESGNPLGRVPGALPLKTEALRRKIQEGDFDPVMELKKIAETSEDEKMRFAALKEICQYYAPKLKQVDVNVDAAVTMHESFIDDMLKD